MDVLPNSMSFRYVASVDADSIDEIPPGFTGRARISNRGRLDTVAWFCNGQLDDPDSRTAAFVRYRHNGRPKQVRHYREGRLHNPSPREPAVVGYYADGSVKYREHYRYGRRHDAGDEAAITKWRNDGSVRVRHHYYEGMRIEAVQAGRADRQPAPFGEPAMAG
ncbi:MAG: hypothetical protein HKN41_10240 [Ilumatobacter sp.]|nr:hypothetical protein [Ilumatobacter sp.]